MLGPSSVSLGLMAVTSTHHRRGAETGHHPEDDDASWDVSRFRQRRRPEASLAAEDDGEPGNYVGCALLSTLRNARCSVAPLNPFDALSDEHCELIAKHIISEGQHPSVHLELALFSRRFAMIAERISVIAHTAAVFTRGARNAGLLAKEMETQARYAAFGKDHCRRQKIIHFNTGTWYGRVSARKRPHGLGVFRTSDGSGVYSAARFCHGLESGPGVYHYKDRSRYAGDLMDGRRHGSGVAESLQGGDRIVRWEGTWSQDRKHGFGVQLGGDFRFAFGFWNNDAPGKLVMWDYHTPDGGAERW